MWGSPGSLIAKEEAYLFNEMSSSEIFPSPVPRYRAHKDLRFLSVEQRESVTRTGLSK